MAYIFSTVDPVLGYPEKFQFALIQVFFDKRLNAGQFHFLKVHCGKRALLQVSLI